MANGVLQSCSKSKGTCFPGALSAPDKIDQCKNTEVGSFGALHTKILMIPRLSINQSISYLYMFCYFLKSAPASTKPCIINPIVLGWGAKKKNIASYGGKTP